jgi:uncharacterized protein
MHARRSIPMVRRQRIILLLVIIFMFSGLNALALSPKVYDKAELFSTSESQELDKRAEELTEKLKLDIVIVTTNDTEGKSTRAYADDFFDYTGFGYNGSKDGILLLIDMQNRQVYISTSGIGIQYFTDERINSVLDNVYNYLSTKNYAEGASTFLNDVETYVNAGIPENQYSQDENTGNSSSSSDSSSSSGSTSYSDSSSYSGNNNYNSSESYYDEPQKKELSLAQKTLICLGISFAAGGIIVWIMALSNRGINTTNQTTYLESNSFRVVGSQDFHYDTKVTYVTIQKNNTGSGSSGGSRSSGSSSGRSTTHTSSSGNSHGGGGRSF